MNVANHDLSPRTRFDRLAGGKAAGLILGACLLITVALHLRVHVGVLGTPWPATLREAAFVLQTEALLDPGAPALYSPESLPEQTNLYGPLYPLAAAPFAALLPDEPYLAHRLAVSVFLLAACALLGWSAARRGGRLAGGVVAGLFYCAMVASPSLAAGPDTLATMLYIAVIVVVAELGCSRLAVLTGTLLALLALMAKPYAVWVLPCFLVYVAWRHSPRRGLEAALFATLAVGVWMAAAHRAWPEYFSSVFLIHAQSATRHFAVLRSQVLEFSSLHFAPLLLVLLFAPYRTICAKVWKRPRAKPADGTQPNADACSIWPLFMSAGAAALLLGSMGWHSGAHLIYFNHLLLPPLLLAAVDLAAPSGQTRRGAIANVLLLSNVIVVLLLVPAAPAPPKDIDLTGHLPALVDPLLEPLRRSQADVELVDNAQAEYWVASALLGKNQARRDRALSWERSLTGKIERGHYHTIMLAPVGARHIRRPIEGLDGLSPALDLHYQQVGYLDVPIYYAYFRNRELFGRAPMRVRIFIRRDKDVAAVLDR